MVWLMSAAFVAFGAMSTIALKRKAGRNRELQRLAAANGFAYVEDDWFSSTRCRSRSSAWAIGR